MSDKPSAFLGGSAYHPPATPPSRTEDTRAAYVPRAEARLTVKADGWVYLNAEAARLLPANLETADLRAPIKERGSWHLDCRPGGLCKVLPVGQSGGLRFRALARVRAMLGCVDSLTLGLEAANSQLFKLYALSANN